jgi:hypothetical protein
MESLKEGKRSEHLGVDERIVLKWIFGKLGWRRGLDSSGTR